MHAESKELAQLRRLLGPSVFVDDFPPPQGPWIRTLSGRKFDFDNPLADQIHIVDIAHSLSRKGRYNDQTLERYTVAQHCVIIADLVPKEFSLWGLLHDAAEAYYGDLPSPLKRLIPDYRALEDRGLKAIVEKYGLEMPEPPIVKHWDKRMLGTEIRDLFGEEAWTQSQAFKTGGYEPIENLQIVPWPEDVAKERFLQTFIDLYSRAA